MIWKLILGYLPPKASEWQKRRQEAQANYESYCKELIIKPDFEEDHPLNIGQESKWGRYFQDQGLWEEIDKDVKRTEETWLSSLRQ